MDPTRAADVSAWDELTSNERQAVYLAALAMTGSSVEATRIAGVSRMTVWRWRQTEEFQELYTKARQMIVDVVEDKAVEVALGGDGRMIRFLLERLAPGQYGRDAASSEAPKMLVELVADPETRDRMP